MKVEQQNSGNGALQIGSVAKGAAVTHKVFMLCNVSITISHPARPQPKLPAEAQRQLDFRTLMGIDCGPRARTWLLQLMTQHQFSAAELSHAWRTRSIGWDQQTHTPWVKTHWLEACMAWVGLAFATLWFGLYALVLAYSHPTEADDWRYLLAAPTLAGAYFVCCWYLARGLLAPRRTALRIRRVTSRRHGGAA